MATDVAIASMREFDNYWKRLHEVKKLLDPDRYRLRHASPDTLPRSLDCACGMNANQFPSRKSFREHRKICGA